jgi:diacylglycerol kinase family enzyme
VAAFGVFTEDSYQTPQDLKNQFGHAAYVLQGMIDLGRIRTYHFRVESDEVSVEDDFVFGMITNSKSVGGFPDITGRSVDMSDGLFEVTLIKMPSNILELNDIVQYLSHAADASDLVFQFKTRHIVLESDEYVKWTRDGEYGGSCRRVELTNLHRALKILVPAE